MVRADLWSGVVFVLLGIASVVESLRLPTLSKLGVNPLSAPGITPGVLGAVLAMLGLVLLLRSLAHVGQAPKEATDWHAWRRLGLTLLLCLGFGAGLVGRVPFWAATALFVFAFVLVFGWTEPRRRSITVASAVALSAGVAFGVTWLFESIFLVRLP